MSSINAVFLDTEVFTGPRFSTLKLLDAHTHCKPTEIFQYTHFSSCHPLNTKKGLVKGEALRLIWTNSIQDNFEQTRLQTTLYNRGYPESLIENVLNKVQFSNRNEALRTKPKKKNEYLPFVTTYNPALPNLRKILIKRWHLIQNQPGFAKYLKTNRL